jgi:hypothetical protein
MTKAFPLAIVLGAILGFPPASDTILKIIDSEHGPLAVSGEVSIHQEFTADTVATQYNISAEVTNTSTKPIMAYEVSVDARAAYGAGLHHIAQTDCYFKNTRDLVAGARDDMSVPAGFTETMAFTKDKAPGTAADATFKVIFVQFADGSTFGQSTWGSTLSQARSKSLACIQKILNIARRSPNRLQTSLTTEITRAENPGITQALMSHVRDTLTKSGPDAVVNELTDYLKVANERSLPENQQCDNSPKTRKTKIHIVSVEFPANDGLSDDLHTLLRKSVEQYEGNVNPEALDTDWLVELNEVNVRNALMNAGYFKQVSRTTPFLVRAEANE